MALVSLTDSATQQRNIDRCIRGCISVGPVTHYRGPLPLCPASVPVVVVQHTSVTRSPITIVSKRTNFPPFSRHLVGLILPLLLLSFYPPFETRRFFSCRFQFNGYDGYSAIVRATRLKRQSAFHLTEWKRLLPYTLLVVVISSPLFCFLDPHDHGSAEAHKDHGDLFKLSLPWR